ncbi:MAG: hypothetical protein LC650_02235 [Actinobacteria bacterium]|nr:hypothetical protein [Actinomycetota bacterium]
MPTNKEYMRLPQDERVERLRQDYNVLVRISTDDAPSLIQVSDWLDHHVGAWAATSVYDGTMDMEIYMHSRRMAVLFGIAWAARVKSIEDC